MKHESEQFVRSCDTCQKFGNVIHSPTIALHSISSPWPFYMWGIDIDGLLPQATRKRKFFLVAIDYFTKWTKVEPYVQIKVCHLNQFLQRSIIYRFKVPHAIVPKNRPQFISKSFQQFYVEIGIKNIYSTPRYPQSNG